VDIPNNKIADFAILQNSRTKVTGLWTKDRGEWIKAERSEYEVLALVAKLIRTAKNPNDVLLAIVKENPHLTGPEE
jgi:hypothetical protein